MIEWHRLLGTGLADVFDGSCFSVISEEILSVTQYLDVLVFESRNGNPPDELPDGFENLSKHNLITFKSHQQSLDSWTIDELVGHYVAYRKKITHQNKMLPEADFSLYAVSARYPTNLSGQAVFEIVKQGVFNVQWGVRQIRLIVLSRLPKEKRNAMWLMFSAVNDMVQFGTSAYQWHRKDLYKTVMTDLVKKYNIEGVDITMGYTAEDYLRDFRKRMLDSLTIDEILEKFPADDVLKKLSPDERLRGLSTDELLKRIPSDERLKGLSLRERLRGLTPEEIEAYLKELKQKSH